MTQQMVVHEPERQRFIIHMGGLEAHLIYRWQDPHRVDACSTFVPPQLRGRGLADLLARAFFDWCDAEGLTAEASCSYVVAWQARHRGG